jgi:formate hydrogenlyase subunit 3/multisubunit Na+/H+ antiporter MnhD subunit
MRLADLAGWVGAATLVVAYAAASAGSLPTESRRAQLLNLVGSVGLGVVAASHRAWPSLTLNAVWLLIALVSLGRVARPRPSGPDPLAR